ncbi:MAG TPA: SGNH/GDSL hydrolase family protein [Thermoanaerobaculia bacterium]|nr:SGNH/GDSL hydrolase family protein [Thermoanaerobaculia bacterium]
MNPSPAKAPTSHRFLALGDSYTIGESVDPVDRWPVQVAAALRAKGLRLEEPEIIARTGWTTDELDKAISAAEPRGTWDLVTLLIGVNNQYRGRGLEEYQNQFRGLLNRAIHFAGGVPSRVVIVSIPDWGATPFAAGRDSGKIAREIDAFNNIARGEAMKVGARFVDITPISRRASTEPALVAHDKLHPSGEMYRAWVLLIIPAALDALKK